MENNVIEDDFQNENSKRNFVLLKTFDNAIDTHILKSKLESEGITCYIFDENIVSMNPLYNNAVGGIKLKIEESDLEKALEVLKEIDQTPYTNDKDEVISCPRCKSEKLISGHRSFDSVGGIFAAIFSILLSALPIYWKRVYKCRDCDYEFKPSKNQPL